MSPHTATGDLEAAIGSIAIVCEQTTSIRRAKLSSVKAGSDEAYYMLAAFCFDLSRKVNYLYRAARQFAPNADPDLAQQLIEDNNAINAEGLSWEQRARAAETIMLRTVDELTDEHARILRTVAARSTDR
jgi:hypothetical protein